MGVAFGLERTDLVSQYYQPRANGHRLACSNKSRGRFHHLHSSSAHTGKTRSVKAKECLWRLPVDKTVLRVRELMEILVGIGVGIEAGVWTVENAERLAASGNPSAA